MEPAVRGGHCGAQDVQAVVVLVQFPQVLPSFFPSSCLEIHSFSNCSWVLPQHFDSISLSSYIDDLVSLFLLT